MSARIRPVVVSALLGALCSPFALAKSGDQDAPRGVFIGSRPKAAPPQRQGAPHASTKPPEKPADPPATRVGLGISVYLVRSVDDSARVDPTSLFHTDQDLRFVVEPNVDGYLYVFLATDDGQPLMIYPDGRLDRGDNHVYAHTVEEVPSRRNKDFNVFRLTGGKATERIFFVVSRSPLPGVPVGDELRTKCPDGPCVLKSGAMTADALAQDATTNRQISVLHDSGAKQTQDEAGALSTRGLVLGAAAAQPSVVAINDSADAPTIVHMLAIRHD